MATSNSEQILAAPSDLKLDSSGEDTVRSERFCEDASVAMKISVEWLWLHDAV